VPPGNDAVWPHSQRKGAHREDPSADETRAAARQRSASSRHRSAQPRARPRPRRRLRATCSSPPPRATPAFQVCCRSPRTGEGAAPHRRRGVRLSVSPCGARLESNRRAHRYHRCAGGSRFRAAPHAPTHPRPVTGSRRSPSGRCWVGCRRRGPAPGRAVCLGQHRGVDRVAEGTRGGVWAEDAPSGAAAVRTGSWARNGHPLTTPGGGLESGAGGVGVPATHWLVVLWGWSGPMTGGSGCRPGPGM
jgi:hypothetical protein